MNARNVWGRDIAAPLSTLQAELHRLYEHYKHVGGTPPGAGPESSAAWTPALDLYETPEEIGILVDLPGIDPESVELSVTGRTLTLRGESFQQPIPHTRQIVRGNGFDVRIV